MADKLPLPNILDFVDFSNVRVNVDAPGIDVASWNSSWDIVKNTPNFLDVYDFEIFKDYPVSTSSAIRTKYKDNPNHVYDYFTDPNIFWFDSAKNVIYNDYYSSTNGMFPETTENYFTFLKNYFPSENTFTFLKTYYPNLIDIPNSDFLIPDLNIAPFFFIACAIIVALCSVWVIKKAIRLYK